MASNLTIVTGASGFAGRHLLDRLGPAPRVRAWCRPGGRAADPRFSVAWEAVDLLDATTVARAIARTKPARIFHLAGAPNVATSWQNSVGHLRTNALGTHNLLDAVREHQPTCRVLTVTSSQIYAPTEDPIDELAPLRPTNPYGLSKLAQDQLALRAAAEDGLDIVVARPFNHIGPGQEPGFAVANFARQIALIEAGLAEPVLRVGNLDARRDFTDVRDVVDAYLRAMEHGLSGQTYNICSGQARPMHDLLDELLRLSTARIRVEIDPMRLRPHDTPVIQGNGSKARAAFGWEPSRPLATTLRDVLSAWREDLARRPETFA